MPGRLKTLAAACNDVLCDGLPQGLKDAIRAAVAKGAGKREIMARVQRIAGRNSLTTLAAGAWCDRMLRENA